MDFAKWKKEKKENTEKRERRPLRLKERVKTAPQKIKVLAGKKNIRLGTYTTATTAIVIALLLVLNLCTAALPEKYTAIDTTSSGIYSISDQTKKVVGGLEQDVTIYYIIQEGQEDETVLQLLKNYEDLSEHIKVEHVDPVQQPGFTQEYAGSDANTNSLVVVSEGRSRYVDYYDIYESDYTYSEDGGYAESSSFNGEGALTSAINGVTSGVRVVSYTLEGHGESDLSSGLGSAIGDANMTVNSLNLLTEGEVPSDCDCLIINGPSSDISKGEAEMLQEYLHDGGRLLLLTDCTSGTLSNLYGVMADYGVEPVEGMVVEGNNNFFVQSYVNYLLPDIESHDITEPLRSSGYYVLAPFAHGLEIDEEKASDAAAEVSVLLRTSSEAYVKKTWEDSETARKSDGDATTDEGFPLGVAIVAGTADSDDSADGGDGQDSGDTSQAQAKIVWYSSAYLGYEQINEVVSGANYDLLLNSVGWLIEQEDSISIHPKSLDQSYLTLTAAQSSRWTVVIVVIIPLAFLMAGFIMWRKRRRM